MQTPEANQVPTVVSGQGATLQLSDGSCLLDFSSGGFGHGAAPVVAAVARQMAVNPLSTRHFLSLPLARFTARLARACPGDLEVAFLCNSRSEAVEGALKLARALRPRRRKLVALAGAYHGATLGALSACDRGSMREALPPLLFEPAFITEPADIGDLIDRETAAVVVEPWPGGRDRPLAEAGWLQRVSARCADLGALLIADESRSGAGVTGALFSVEHEGVVPDVLVVGGAIGGGVLPLAGYVTRPDLNDKVYGRRDPTLHASTTGGNPASCEAGMAVLETIEREDLVARADANGRHLLSALLELRRRLPGTVGAVRGAGLFVQVPIAGTDVAAVAAAARDRGLSCEVDPGLPGIVLRPPLLVRREEIDLGIEALDAALAAALAGRVVAR